MAKNKRVEVLFEPSEYRTLEDAAHREGKSVGSMVREAVAKYVTDSDRARRKQALDWILAQDFSDLPPWEELKEEMAEAEAREFDKLYETD